MCATHDVGKGLVDGDPLNEGREIIEYRDGRIAKPLVVLEVAADKVSCGQSSRAWRPGIPRRTPKALAS